MADTEYLDEERKKTWERIKVLEEALPAIRKLAEEAKSIAESKISATEEEAKKALDTALKEKDEAAQLLNEIKEIVQNYKENKITLKNAVNAANQVQAATDDINARIEILLKNEENIATTQANISISQKEASSDLSSAKNTMENVANIENEVSSSLKKITDLQAKASDKKSEIDDLYDEIMGYEKENGEREEGLKKELEDSYTQLKKQYATLQENFSIFTEESHEKLDTFLKSANNSKDAVVKEIRSYLPDSVTAGLAGAFNKKKEEEIDEREKATKKFLYLIYGMVAVAILPFFVYAVLFFQEKSIDDIILKIPNMTVAVLPLYAPLIWLAIHLNHRINLSKKLIEEYAYKEAVCKSFAGLSEQIEAINDKETLQELRLKLIDLVMTVNSDNPGKYIKNYDKCDNPLIEVLNRLEKTSHIKINGNEWDIQMSDTKETLPKENITM